MKSATSAAAAGAGIALVRVYQWTLRPLLGTNCRFHPSCSDYAIEALRTHGAVRGLGLAVWRILRCNPFCQGGADPVPPPARPPERASAGPSLSPPASTPHPSGATEH